VQREDHASAGRWLARSLSCCRQVRSHGCGLRGRPHGRLLLVIGERSVQGDCRRGFAAQQVAPTKLDPRSPLAFAEHAKALRAEGDGVLDRSP
jgi:hypothetical protein